MTKNVVRRCAIEACDAGGSDPDGLCFWHFCQWMVAKEFTFAAFKARVEGEGTER
jgi:hypothetical protein